MAVLEWRGPGVTLVLTELALQLTGNLSTTLEKVPLGLMGSLQEELSRPGLAPQGGSLSGHR